MHPTAAPPGSAANADAHPLSSQMSLFMPLPLPDPGRPSLTRHGCRGGQDEAGAGAQDRGRQLSICIPVLALQTWARCVAFCASVSPSVKWAL